MSRTFQGRRALAAAVALAVLAAAPARARADETAETPPTPEPPAPARGEAPRAPRGQAFDDDAFEHLVLDAGRPRTEKPERDVVRFVVHGEYQLRGQAVRSYLLAPTVSTQQAKPGIVGDSTGQNAFVNHWLRLTPRLQIRDFAQIVGQIDVLTGLVGGDRTHDVSADRFPRDAYDGFRNVQPRWLWLELTTPVGLVRVGQQPNHWGMGILANDGDHPTLFGDYRGGSISERVLFATKPFGRQSDVVVALAGDLVFRDQFAQLTQGDRAFQGVLAAFWERGPNRFGFFGTYRSQRTDRESDVARYTDGIDAAALDLHGRFVKPLPGDHAYAFLEGEAAMITGSATVPRTKDQALAGDRTALRSWGGAVKAGLVVAGTPEGGSGPAWKQHGKAPRDYGRVVAAVEAGYASGDADPYDGVERRFTFDPNHRIGLLLFDEVLRFQTARSASAAMDPRLANAARPTPGVELLPSNGGVQGASYVNPTAILRPGPNFDVKLGMVLAQTSAENVDPYRVATTGAYANHRGGDRRARDLGTELDVGVEGRIPLDYAMRLVLGAQGALLFPGSALADATGALPKTPWLAVARAGLLF